MNKGFFKRKATPKVFFDKNMAVRSCAYGAAVAENFAMWQRTYANSTRGVVGDPPVLSAQPNLFGSADGAKAPPYRPTAQSLLPPLYFDAMHFTVREDGWVLVNGNRSALCLGAELKGWGILTFSEQETSYSSLCAVGKPVGCSELRLSLYALSRRGPAAEADMWVTLEHTLSPESPVLCLGRHIFVVHDAKLNYYYCNKEENDLETVAIGRDAPNDDAPWCRHVTPYLVINGRGCVFWMAGEDIYGFAVGYPKRLFSVPARTHERTVGLACDREALLVYRQSKTTSKITCYRYADF